MFLSYPNTDSMGHDITHGWEIANRTSLHNCKEKCLNDAKCNVMMYGKKEGNTHKGCWTKTQLNKDIERKSGKDGRFDVYVKECDRSKNFVDDDVPYKQIPVNEKMSQSEVEKYCFDRADGKEFFYQRHKNGHTICGFYENPLPSSAEKVKHGHTFGGICKPNKSSPSGVLPPPPPPRPQRDPCLSADHAIKHYSTCCDNGGHEKKGHGKVCETVEFIVKNARPDAKSPSRERRPLPFVPLREKKPVSASPVCDCSESGIVKKALKSDDRVVNGGDKSGTPLPNMAVRLDGRTKLSYSECYDTSLSQGYAAVLYDKRMKKCIPYLTPENPDFKSFVAKGGVGNDKSARGITMVLTE
jgi:hypothetical protein